MARAMARVAALLLLLAVATATHEYCSPGAFALSVTRCPGRIPRPSTDACRARAKRGGAAGRGTGLSGRVLASFTPHLASPSVSEMDVALAGGRGQ